MPTYPEMRESQNAALASVGMNFVTPHYTLGVRHAVDIVTAALTDEMLTSHADGNCWSCGAGNDGAPIYALSRTTRYGGEYTEMLEALNTVVQRIATRESGRTFHGVTLHSRSYYVTTTPARINHVALCGNCYEQLKAAIERAIAVQNERVRRADCVHCEMPVSGDHLGYVINTPWLTNTHTMHGDQETAWMPYGVDMPDDDLSFSVRQGRAFNTVNGTRTRYLCTDCQTERYVCWTCGNAHLHEDNCTCSQCGYSYLCSDCYASGNHDAHFSPRDFTTHFSVGDAIAHAAHHARPGSTVRSTRTVGQEVEAGGNGRQRVSALGMRDLDRAARDALGTSVIANIGTDCSIELDDAYEIRGMPVSGYVAEIYAEGMAEALNSGHWTHNLSCGAHVHVGVTNGEFWRAYAGHVLTQEIPIMLSDPRRFEGRNRYCARIQARDVQAVRDALVTHDGVSYQELRRLMTTNAFFERYVTVNASAFGSHRTIEIRTGSGDLPHNAERNTHYLAWIAGATDYFVSDHGFTFLQSEFTTDALLADMVAQGHVTQATADHILGAFENGGIDTSEIMANEADGDSYGTTCYNCDCACNDCPCDDRNCAECDCGYDPCDHDSTTRHGNYYRCDNCDEITSYV